MLIITGTGRCGTTLIADFCCKLGYETGGKLFGEDLTEGREAGNVRFVNKQSAIITKNNKQVEYKNTYLKPVFSFINEIIEDSLEENINNIEQEVVKDPNFFNHYEACLDYWIKHKKDLKFLIMIRDLKDSYDSAKKKGFDFLLCHEKTFEDWEKRVYKTHFEFVKKLTENNIPFQYLKFPDVIDNYPQVHKTLTDLGLKIDYKKGEDVWGKLVNEKLIHYNGGEQDG